MSGEYSLPCQRCTKNNCVQRKIDRERSVQVFAVATGRQVDDVRLCGSCLRTVDSLIVSVGKAKARKGSRWRP